VYVCMGGGRAGKRERATAPGNLTEDELWGVWPLSFRAERNE